MKQFQFLLFIVVEKLHLNLNGILIKIKKKTKKTWQVARSCVSNL